MADAPEPIRVAVARLAGIPGVVLDSSPEFISDEPAWAFRFRLTSARVSEFVPKETCWVALVDCSYPAGSIRMLPAQANGLVHTFPHQDRNVMSSARHACWRLGKPCLDSPSRSLGRIAGGPEPYGDAELRLAWHVERCLAWLEVAATDQLMVDGEPFEVPQCPLELLSTRFSVVHDEGADTSAAWDGRIGKHGEIRWGTVSGFKNTIVAEQFLDANGERIRTCRRPAEQRDNPWVGYWWLWPCPIVIPPWHAPTTWAELRQVGARLDVDVDAFTRWMARRAGGDSAAIILLGYMIPRLWNGDAVEVHWQAILPPNVPVKIEPMNGFRNNERGRNDRLRRDIFSGGKELSYLRTANWHPDRLQARGRLPSEIRTHSVAVVGAGALGSAVAELLARGGVSDMLIVDHGDLEAGNLVRHTLTGVNLRQNKAAAIAVRLQAAAPMSCIAAHPARLPQGEALRELLEPFDVVVDCTGEDDVLRHLGAGWWSVPRHFLSASLGFAARRLFLFSSHACCFPFDEFDDAVRPWLDEERSSWSDAGETLEGAGCWSPLFPARSDDVWLAAVATVKYLERVRRGEMPAGLHVLEQTGGEFVGYRPVQLDEAA